MNPLPLVAVAGSPNAGKSALFNALTGARQKVGNYPGVTVERKSGRLTLADGRPVELVDLPGAYSLDPASPDEAVTRDVLLGRQQGERQPDALVIVLDASNLDNHLRFALQLIELGLPTVIALNMVDLAKRDGLELDPEAAFRSTRRSGCRDRRGSPPRHCRSPGRRRRHALGAAVRRPQACEERPRSPAAARPRNRERCRRQRNAGPPLDPSPRRCPASPGLRPDHPRRDHVRDVSGGVRLEPGPVDWIAVSRGLAVGSRRGTHCRRDCSGHSSSMARSPASARSSPSCRRS